MSKYSRDLGKTPENPQMRIHPNSPEMLTFSINPRGRCVPRIQDAILLEIFELPIEEHDRMFRRFETPQRRQRISSCREFVGRRTCIP